MISIVSLVPGSKVLAPTPAANDNGEHERHRYEERPATNFHGFLPRQIQRLFA
jgi:hypothetical protein